ncbi:MAG: hypothetical protein PVF15_03490 [Candidatus Bathyarchaeota archaeon]|jgi:hypothetical protein
MLNAIVAWLVYAIWGSTSAFLQGEKFNPYKLARSLLWALIVAVTSLITGLPPQLTIEQFDNFIVQILGLVMNQGWAISLIWFFDRLYNVITAVRTRLATWFAQAQQAT